MMSKGLSYSRSGILEAVQETWCHGILPMCRFLSRLDFSVIATYADTSRFQKRPNAYKCFQESYSCNIFIFTRTGNFTKSVFLIVYCCV